MSESFFADTFALMEIIKGNTIYEKYKNKKLIITIFNLMEFHYNLLKITEEKIAKDIALSYQDLVIEISINNILEANIFRYKNKEKKLSFTDCLGYVIAKEMKIKFLTGDKQFQNMENVEFVR